MAKKKIRMVTASTEDKAAIIDRGAEVKTSLENLTYEDKGVKVKISEIAEVELVEDETSIRLEGNEAIATVSISEKVNINVKSERFPALQKAVKSGFLADVVSVKTNIVISQKDMIEAEVILRLAGISSKVIETLSVKADDVRIIRKAKTQSLEESKAEQALLSCIESVKSYRVKYDNK